MGFSLPQTDRAVIGGYFTWLTLPEKLDRSAQMLANRCKADENVIVAAGKIFEVPGDEGVKFEIACKATRWSMKSSRKCLE